MTTPGPLRRDGERVYALPSFRILLHIDRALGDPSMKHAAGKLLALFLEGLDHTDMIFGHAGGRIKKLGAEYINDKVIAKAVKWAAETEWQWPSTLRFARWFDDFDCSGPPHIRLEQRAYLATIQIELPPDDPRCVIFAERVQQIVADLPVIWGVMGYGMFQPVALDSLIFLLPRVATRYRCAIEVQPDRVESALRREASFEQLRLGETPVLSVPDIGWRTLVGREFLERLPDLAGLAGAEGLSVVASERFTSITAGPQPIWGDVNEAEDISLYSSVADALRPVRADWPYASKAFFGGAIDNSGLDRLEAWYGRFDA
ncbi:uncharacterized protein DUF3396 [Rhodobacter sp. JA431]|uniref:DUF3396 domain-containing protein n=1 Tax=Rhodobacter sp. JA431 TaxID=570013 RepID=UPI000BDCD650|nr:DUF3396 domain-containing protein [Rhodobacter sp. JA431]SOC04332.1 uncharacterized protein DUF3396 [Rhodobacter sp. JA431]